jgi:RNA polymerase sigma factor (sigma-70 family)
MKMGSMESYTTAEDLYQEVWLSICENVDLTKDGPQLTTYVHTRAHGVCNNYIRDANADKREIEIPFSQLDPSEIVEGKWSPTGSGPDKDEADQYDDNASYGEIRYDAFGRAEPTPEELVLAEEISDEVAHYLTKSKLERHKILYLHVYEGLDPEELAARFNIKENAVYFQIHSARADVDDMLARIGCHYDDNKNKIGMQSMVNGKEIRPYSSPKYGATDVYSSNARTAISRMIPNESVFPFGPDSYSGQG